MIQNKTYFRNIITIKNLNYFKENVHSQNLIVNELVSNNNLYIYFFSSMNLEYG